ncbi:MAG: hypothetical protein V1708_04965 [Candidatus Micrarchaeota archaeon]
MTEAVAPRTKPQAAKYIVLYEHLAAKAKDQIDYVLEARVDRKQMALVIGGADAIAYLMIEGLAHGSPIDGPALAGCAISFAAGAVIGILLGNFEIDREIARLEDLLRGDVMEAEHKKEHALSWEELKAGFHHAVVNSEGDLELRARPPNPFLTAIRRYTGLGRQPMLFTPRFAARHPEGTSWSLEHWMHQAGEAAKKATRRKPSN